MEWDLDEEGNIIVCPLTAFVVAEAMETAILARLEYVTLQDGREVPGLAQVFLLTPTEALELAKVLAEKAYRILQQKPSTKPS
jgi:hypothetical protein